MLFALLYNRNDQLIAAAPACEQLPFGNSFWIRVHQAQIRRREIFETAYQTIIDPYLQARLRWLGIDDTIDGEQLTLDLERSTSPTPLQPTQRAA